ncbi:MarR family winged helix-turn-helix transcriptional regulator [Paraburkholderia sp. SG-MS1]|uniref:MarR family winged helix-turn-helix transcriptional regulator n=1 Tax=Paraburkholderia sp. SG-MS1 TaxID=2023741 RepID=UPI001EEA7957|nr:MarR family transcriptional regulator [Paraburkholderia sp. SG-MS1]
MPRALLESAFSSGIAPFYQLWRGAANQAVPRAFGLSHALAWPLVLINNSATALRQSELATLLGIENSSMVRLVDQLCAAGFVQRIQDPEDRRVNMLGLTEVGREWAVSLESAVAEFRAQALSGITTQELEICLQVFTRIQNRLASNEGGRPTLGGNRPSGTRRGDAHAPAKS